MILRKLGGKILQKIGLIQTKPLLYDISRTERIVEYSWVLKNLDLRRGKILDIGCTGTLFPIMLASLGYEVVGIDLKDYNGSHPNFKFIKCDILDPPRELLGQKFDVITSISAIEHVGLGNENTIKDGDIRAIKIIKNLLREKGILFLTFGYGGEFRIHKRPSQPNIPFGRLYDEERINRLAEGFEIVERQIFKREKENWKPCSMEEAKKFIYPKIWDKTFSIICLKLQKSI
jgi:SAM-dependent methyltransferase